MLKKLVKYGNSNALIFDKAILELLEISEGSILKIKTDGKSLIITPHSLPTNEATITTTINHNDAVMQNMFHNMFKQYGNLSPERQQTLAQEYKALSDKRQSLVSSLEINPDFHKSLLVLREKYNNTPTPELAAELTQLMESMIPELTKINHDLVNFEKIHNLTPASHHPSPEAIQQLSGNFVELFKKHASASAKIKTTIEDENYIHETQLLTEKFANLPKGILSPEYYRESKEILYKYVPEARAMDEEMKTMGSTLQKTQ